MHRLGFSASQCVNKNIPTNISDYLQIGSDEEKTPDDKYDKDLSKKLPQGTEKRPEVLNSALKGLPDRYVIAYVP